MTAVPRPQLSLSASTPSRILREFCSWVIVLVSPLPIEPRCQLGAYRHHAVGLLACARQDLGDHGRREAGSEQAADAPDKAGPPPTLTRPSTGSAPHSPADTSNPRDPINSVRALGVLGLQVRRITGRVARLRVG